MHRRTLHLPDERHLCRRQPCLENDGTRRPPYLPTIERRMSAEQKGRFLRALYQASWPNNDIEEIVTTQTNHNATTDRGKTTNDLFLVDRSRGLDDRLAV